MLFKIGRSILIGAGIGFAVGFTEELILSATGASPETKDKVRKATGAATTVAAIGSLFV